MLVKLPWDEYVSNQDVLTVCLEPNPKEDNKVRVRVTMKGTPYSHSPWMVPSEAEHMAFAVAKVIGIDDLEGEAVEGEEEPNGLIQLPWKEFVNPREVLTVCLEPKHGTRQFRVRVTMKGNGNPYAHSRYMDRVPAKKMGDEVAETIGVEEVIEEK